MDAISLGPIVLSFERFTIAVTFVVLVIVAEIFARKGAKDLSNWASNVILVALLSARVGFVLVNLASFADRPFSIFYFWQGGFSNLAGLMGAASYSVWFYRKDFSSLKTITKPVIAAFLIWGALLGFSASQVPAISALPDLSLETLSGEMLETDSLEGPVVLNVWATWCGPCKREMPMLERAQKEHQTINFLFLDQQESAATVQAYLDQEELELENVLLDRSGEVGNLLRIKGTPTTLFFNANRELTKRHVGELSRAALEIELKKLE